MNPDFWELNNTPGFFANSADAADWINANKGDPYWMAHQLNNANMQDGYGNFVEYWKLAREIHSYDNHVMP
jgi:hypothetical protein